MFRVKEGTILLFFVLTVFLGSCLTLLISKTCLYGLLSAQKRKEGHAQIAAVTALLEYGKQWVLQEKNKEETMQTIFWHGPWWPDTKEWMGYLQIYQEKDDIVIIASVSKSGEHAISCKRSIKKT